MTVSLEQTQGSVKSAPATLQKSAIRIDGRLTKQKAVLHFSAFSADSLYGPYELSLQDISKVETCWGKGAGILPITPDAIQVTLSNGERYQFIVANPEDWVATLTS